MVNAGLQIKIVNIGASVTHTNSKERSQQNSKEEFKEHQVKYTFSLENSITAAAGKITACRDVYTFQKADLPFRLKVLRVYGDKRSEEMVIKGIWRGNMFNESVSKCKSYPIP